MRVTIEEIAKESGFSSATVSRVLAKSKNVDNKTREKILTVMKELDYRPNKLSKIIEKKSKIVLLIVGDILNPFYSNITKSIDLALCKFGYTVLLCDANYEKEKTEKLLKIAIEYSLLGVILISSLGSHDSLNEIIKKNIPIVFVNRYLPSINADVVSTDDYKGTYMAVKYLIDLGHKRISYLKGPNVSSASRRRKQAYVDVMESENLKIYENDIAEGDLRRTMGYEFGEQILKKKKDITAVVCGNDLMALGLIDYFLDNGKSIPRDLSIIGYDDSPVAISGKVHLTTVKIPTEDIGNTAASLIIQRITNSKQPYKRIILEPLLIERQSVGVLR